MKKTLRRFFGVSILIVLMSPFAHSSPPAYLMRSVYREVNRIKIPGALYFTPAASTGSVAAFACVSKIKPTPQEIAEEQKRINTIIDGTIKDTYGSWDNYEKALRRESTQAAESYEKQAPLWTKRLMPPTLIKETVPLLMKGALMFAKAHPEMQEEPIGKVGETGVVLIHSGGRFAKIKLGINQPVESLSFSPDGKTLAVLSDLSFEDKSGVLHVLGRISVISIPLHKVIKTWILNNITDEIKFSPNGSYLTFLVESPKNWKKSEIAFIDTHSWRLTPKLISFCSLNMSGDFYGKNYHVPHCKFSFDGKTIALLLNDKSIGLYDVESLQSTFKIRGGGGAFAFSRNRPFLFDDNGRL